jgi:hypothetical protein
LALETALACDWGAQKIVALKEDVSLETEIAGNFGLSFSIDWLRDGRLLVVAGGKNALLRQEPDDTFGVWADLAAISTQSLNEIVMDGRDKYLRERRPRRHRPRYARWRGSSGS